MANFRLEIIIPQGKVYSKEIEFLLVRTTEGDMGVLANHSPFVAELLTGEMLIKEKKGIEIPYYISGGFLEISFNKVTILVDEAILASEIDIEKAKQEVRIAEEKLKKLKEEKNIVSAQQNLQEALTKVNIAQKLL